LPRTISPTGSGLGILKKFGIRADAVAQGAEALKSLESIPYDLVLMDMRMPVMDGLEATRRIRSPKSAVLNHAIPIIAMTANAIQSGRDQCMEAGMNDFITKPLSAEALLEVIEKWLAPAKRAACPTPAAVSNPQPPPERSACAFDAAGVLTRMMGNHELAQWVVEASLSDIPLQIELLKGMFEAEDAAGSGRQAHSIKGAAANAGAEELRKVAYEMEKAADAGDLALASGHMAELQAQFIRFRDAVREDEYATAYEQ